MPLDDDDRAMLRSVRRYLDHVHAEAMDAAGGPGIGEVVGEHLGVDPATLPVVEETLAAHRLVDADVVLHELADASGGRIVGVRGGDQRMHLGLADLLRSEHRGFGVGPVDAASRATGHDSTREVVTFGVWLLAHEGAAIAVLQRDAAPQYGRSTAALEVVGVDRDAVAGFLAHVRERMIARSVLRGAVLTFGQDPMTGATTTTFLPRPDVGADEIVLRDGVLDGIVEQVVGIGEHGDELRSLGQHLKRGVLLYGPPGTGKTLTVRHLLARTTGTTAVVLTGTSIAHVSAAAEVARTFEPSIVVLEDVDLVAMERMHSPQPLLFEVLDALDGLDGDADVAFLLTTNRVEVLEPALAQRPGRVDLAVEVPLPGATERRRLLEQRASGTFSPEAIARTAEATDGTTGSFAKELVRRAMLRAATRGTQPTDDDLDAALAALLDTRATLTRRMLGGEAGTAGGGDDDPGAPYGGSHVASGW